MGWRRMLEDIRLPSSTLEATQRQMNGFFSQLPYKCNLEEVACVEIDFRFALSSTAGWR